MLLRSNIAPKLSLALALLFCLPAKASLLDACLPLRRVASKDTLTFEKKNLGKGSEGLVHMAKDAFGQKFALKAHADDYVKYREYDITNKIHRDKSKHPALFYIVRYSLAEVEGREYLAAPFYKMDLQRLLLEIKNGILPASAFDAQRFLDKLRQGIDLIHEAGFVHADLKPQNIAVDADFNPIIIDFGLAVKIGKKHEGGTLPYMSPNQRSEGYAEPNDDIVGGLRGIKADIENAMQSAKNSF